MLSTIDVADVEGVRDALARDGGCIVSNYLDDSTRLRLLEDFGPHLEEMSYGLDDLGYRNEFYGVQTKRLHGLFSKSPLMETVLTHPLMAALTKQAFIESGMARDVRLSNCELMVLGTDQDVQDFHTDGVSWARAQQQEDGEILYSVNIALTPFTETNGAARVVPGSHLWPPGREPQAEEICQAVMPAGSALVYSGNVIHSGGANREDEERVGLYLGYIPSWLRPIENQLVTNKPDDILALSDRARVLLDVSAGGFTVYA